MPVSSYTVTEAEDENKTSEKVYTYDEAIDLAGDGCYSKSFVGVLSIAALAMGCDMFGFSVVVTGATCDFQLSVSQTSVLLSMSFIGPIVMAYPWGYLSDTQGRRKSLLISLWCGCLVSSISAFSPNWIVLATLKFISTCFASCVQSVTYTLVGESCPRRVRDGYMLIMTSTLECVLAFYIGIAYSILNLNFKYSLGFISFTPWRLLVLVLASTLGVAALGVHLFYESPKFLLNAGHDKEVLDILRKIHKRNGGTVGSYPVKKVYLDEIGNTGVKNVPLKHSLWRQIVPLFQPPLLWRSLQLYFLAFVVFGTSNSYYIWFPYLAQKFIDGMSSTGDQVTGLCNMIVSNHGNITENMQCISKLEISLFWSTLVLGVVFVTTLFCIARIAHRKRLLMAAILLFSSICGIAAVATTHNIISLIMFFGTMTNSLMIGLIYSFIVDLYPTSYRGMAACLGTMVARSGALSGVNLLGAFVMSHCPATFIVCSVLMMVAVLVTFQLPADKPRI